VAKSPTINIRKENTVKDGDTFDTQASCTSNKRSKLEDLGM
jgi:hypothetical protein